MAETLLFDGLSLCQLDALCNVAFGGNGGGVNQRTLKSLRMRGLVEPVVRQEREGNMLFSVTTWTMPIHVHIAFCDWCSRQPLHDLADLQQAVADESPSASDHNGGTP